MLTRLKIQGFKNLDSIDVRFGPFTCIAGPNGVGKSNLFDAIMFLSALADKPLTEAAASVRGSEGRIGDVSALFYNASGERAEEMSFELEMIVPRTGTDELGDQAEASMTFLHYELRLRHRNERSGLGPLEVTYESMDRIKKTDARDRLRFPHSTAWRDSVIDGKRSVPYMETSEEDGRTIINIRADSKGGKGGGRARKLLASNMPRTVLSTASNAAEYRTLVLARKEMMAWTQFQLEPSALRSPDPFGASRRIGPNGAHLPAALYGLAKDREREGETMEDVYQEIANRLAELFENIRDMRVDEDEKREVFSIVLTDLQHSDHLASSLSDGTLRFLALAIIEASPHGPPVLCLEEPENGIHPDRVEAMLQLLQDIAVNVDKAVGPDNPMRQVILNTHSPEVIRCVPENTLLFAQAPETFRHGRRERRLILEGLAGTWRVAEGEDAASLSAAMSYLRPAIHPTKRSTTRENRRITEREDVQLSLSLLDWKPAESAS